MTAMGWEVSKVARGHTSAGTSGAFGHDGQQEDSFRVRGRQAGGKLHRAGTKKRKPEETIMASKAVVVHKEKIEVALEAKIVAALGRANTMVVANRQVVADAQFARLQAVDQIAPFVSAAESVRERLMAAGHIR